MMNIRILKTLVAAALLAGAATGASADDLKIGYVNSDKVLRDALPAKAAQAKLEAEFSKREKDLTDIAARLKAASDKLDKDRELQRKRREFQEDLSQRKNEELGAVVERTNKVIKQIFETEKYDLILQEAVFWSAKVDITDKVIKALNAQGGK